MIHLPSDPSLPETWLLFLGIIVIPVTFVIIFGLTIYKKTHLLRNISIIMLLALPAIYLISARNFGEWGQLKSLLQNYEVQVNQFIIENGAITTLEKKMRLYEHYPPPQFKFSGSNEIIYVQYLEWISSNSKIGISWGRDANASFDLGTMICIYSD